MTVPRHRFDAEEIAGWDGEAGDPDVAEAVGAARVIEASLPSTDASVSPDLADRIMAAVRREPPPRAAGILVALRRRPSPAGVVDSLRVAWARILGAGSVAVRATALAYVALILILGVSLSGVAAYTTAGALGLLPPASHGPDQTHVVASPHPLRSPEPTGVESPEPGETAGPDQSSEPTEGPSDDHGDASAEPGHSDDHGGGGSGSGHTPRPSDTPRPGDTPNASDD